MKDLMLNSPNNSGILDAWARNLGTRYLNAAGIHLGNNKSPTIEVLDDAFFRRVLFHGSLGLGESYMEALWTSEDLEELIFKLLLWRNAKKRFSLIQLPAALSDLRRWLFNYQKPSRAKHVINEHYNLPLPLFEAMLGKTMAYSCAYWKQATSLDTAQTNKFDIICQKLELTPTDRVLDIGCGFGSFAKYAAKHYGCSVTAVTLSELQAEYARQAVKDLPVDVYQCDYRDTDQYSKGKTFDKIASIAMFEAVGHKNYHQYMATIHSLLADKTLWLLHTIGDNYCSSDPWLNKYIFPNGELPTLGQISVAARGLFEIEDLHNFAMDYHTTLTEWERNFQHHWPTLTTNNPEFFDERFFRKWMYYLNCCKAAFRSRNMQLWQIVMTKGYLSTPYQSIR